MNYNLGLTKAFIADDPVTLTFQHYTRESDGAGGWTSSAATTSFYTVRLIPQDDKVPLSSSIDGTRSAPVYVMLGLPTFDIRKGDTFEWAGITWMISHRHLKPHYEGKWDVVKYEH